MTNQERNEKIVELRLELIKSRLSNKKTAKLNTREIKRTVARLLTFNNANKEPEVKKQEKKTEVKTETKKSEKKVKEAKK